MKGVIGTGGVRLTNIRFATDDIVFFFYTFFGVQNMLKDLRIACLEVELKMNRAKTKILTNGIKIGVKVDGEELLYVEDYVYLCQILL